jgi:hypothetical protein
VSLFFQTDDPNKKTFQSQLIASCKNKLNENPIHILFYLPSNSGSLTKLSYNSEEGERKWQTKKTLPILGSHSGSLLMLILPLDSVANVSEANAASIFKVKVSCMSTHFDHEDRSSVYVSDSGNSVHIRTVQ